MSAPADITPGASPEAAAAARADLRPTKPLYWSVRRELWENRSIVIAPLAVAAVMLFGALVAAFVRHTVTAVRTTTTMAQGARVTTKGVTVLHGSSAAGWAESSGVALLVTLFIVAVFYCLGALHNERRDRSILFWKSLPVSDLTTVAAKAIVPLAILPLTVLGITLATQLLVLLINTASIAARGGNVAELWTQAPLASLPLVVVYTLATATLWWAPLYGWLLLVSGWARRAPFLWAVLPPLLVALAEKIAFGTGYVSSMISYRLLGVLQQAFVVPTKAAFKAGTAFPGGLPEMDPAKFLSTPGLWIGLAVAGAFLAAAIWLRRYREPI